MVGTMAITKGKLDHDLKCFRIWNVRFQILTVLDSWNLEAFDSWTWSAQIMNVSQNCLIFGPLCLKKSLKTVLSTSSRFSRAQILGLDGIQNPTIISKISSFVYLKDTEPLYHSFMYSPVSLLSSIYPLPKMDSLLVSLYVMGYLIGINQRINQYELSTKVCISLT